MTYQVWTLPPELSASLLETGSTSATWMASSAAWMGLAATTLATMGVVGSQMAASLSSISGVRSAVQAAATPPFMMWLATLAGIAFKQAIITALVAESYGMARSTMIPSFQSINNRVRELAAEATNFFGQNTPLIAALNAEYMGYMMDNTAIGTTYGQVITAATLPVPIPPAPMLSNPATTVAQAGDALAQAGQTLASSGGGPLTQAVSQATNPAASSGDMTSMLGQAGSLFSAPTQVFQQAGKIFTEPFGQIQQFLNPLTQMFGSNSSLGDLLTGGQTGNSFVPALNTSSSGLPLTTGSGPGLVGSGGITPGIGSTLTQRPGETITARNTVLSGVSTNPSQERVVTAGNVAPGGGGIPPGMMGAPGAHVGQGRRGDALVMTFGAEDHAVRRSARGSERDLFT